MSYQFMLIAALSLGVLTPLSLPQPAIADVGTPEGVLLRPEEAALQANIQNAIQLGQELSALQQIPPNERTAAQEQRILELQDIQRALSAEFEEFINSPAVRSQLDQLRVSSRGQHIDVENLRRLQAEMAQLETPAILYYPLILEDRLELIVVTADAPPLRRTVEVDRAELNQAIVSFRQALDNPRSDVQPIAYQLYQWLIQPIEGDLADSGAEAILAAPDGALRYIPLGALHDGDQWLVERFAMNTITSANLTDFSPSPQRSLNVLAAAYTEGGHTATIADREVTLSALPYTGVEVDAIASLLPNTTLLKGSNFTRSTLLSQLSDHSVLHLATNAFFIPGSPTDSFLVMGDGDIVTLEEIRTWPLSAVELVVLSACDTGLGGFDQNGQEILGLGYQFQRAGADAVIASLWLVSDSGTATLMEAFYTALAQDETSFSEALRQAQLALIYADDSEAATTRQNQNAELRYQPQQQTAGLSHPYYWAPFILIGNGL